MNWTIAVTWRDAAGSSQTVPVATFERPDARLQVADFGLSLGEGHVLLAKVQRVVAQHRVDVYTAGARSRAVCGRYRRTKDIRPTDHPTTQPPVHPFAEVSNGVRHPNRNAPGR